MKKLEKFKDFETGNLEKITGGVWMRQEGSFRVAPNGNTYVDMANVDPNTGEVLECNETLSSFNDDPNGVYGIDLGHVDSFLFAEAHDPSNVNVSV